MISEPLPRITAGKRRMSSFVANVRSGSAPMPAGTSTHGRAALFACDTAARIDSVCGFVTEPMLTRSPSVVRASCVASPMSSTTTGEAPAANSAFAACVAPARLARHSTKGFLARSVSNASAVVFSIDSAVTPVRISGVFFLRTISSSGEKSSSCIISSLSLMATSYLGVGDMIRKIGGVVNTEMQPNKFCVFSGTLHQPTRMAQNARPRASFRPCT